MTRFLRFRGKALLMGVACTLGMLAFEGSAARAGILMELSLDGGVTFTDLAAFTTPLASDPGQLNNYGTVNIDLLNAFLTGAGSAYQFSSLGGISNWAGQPTGGTLTLNGGVFLPVGAVGSTSLMIRETEVGFTSPSGTSGTLKSSSTGNFNSAGAGNSHLASSSFNAVTTPNYLIASTNIGPDNEGTNALMGIPAFVSPYTLRNTISISLTPSATFRPEDSFGVTAMVTAAVIPEPASMVTMLFGLSMPLLGLALVRRHRAEAMA